MDLYYRCITTLRLGNALALLLSRGSKNLVSFRVEIGAVTSLHL
jgi:hypothetical protein